MFSPVHHKMFLNKSKKLIVIIINITAIVVLAEFPPSCYCTGSQRVIHVFSTHQVHNGDCCLSGLSELLSEDLSKYSVSEFIVHEGTYIMNEDLCQ